jgi:hypothetical protein
VCSISYPACAVLHCYLWPVRLYHIFPRNLINGTIFWKKLLNIKYLFWFSLQTNDEGISYSVTQRDILIFLTFTPRSPTWYVTWGFPIKICMHFFFRTFTDNVTFRPVINLRICNEELNLRNLLCNIHNDFVTFSFRSVIIYSAPSSYTSLKCVLVSGEGQV